MKSGQSCPEGRADLPYSTQTAHDHRDFCSESQTHNSVPPKDSQCPDRANPLPYLSLQPGQAPCVTPPMCEGTGQRELTPHQLHTNPELPYTSLTQTSRANVNVLLAPHHAACLYNNWSQSARAAHTCWCLHIPCKKLATTGEIQEPNRAQLALPSPKPTHQHIKPLQEAQKNPSAKGINVHIPSSPCQFGGPDVARFLCHHWNAK